MSVFSNGTKELKKPDAPLHKAPKSVQDLIELVKVSGNGIFQVGVSKFSKSYRIQDINFITCNQEEQEEILMQYCKVLNSLDCRFKITIDNRNKDMDQMREDVLISHRGDEYDRYRDIYNDIIENKINEGRQGIEQDMYLTVTIDRKDYEEAKAEFTTLEATMFRSFQELGSMLTPIQGAERLGIINSFYHMESHDKTDFDIEFGKRSLKDFKNDLANTRIRFFSDHYEDEEKYVRGLFIKKYPSSIPVDFIRKLMALPFHSMLSIDVVPIPKDLTTRILKNKYLGVENDIRKQQAIRNKNNDFSSDISYQKQVEKKEIASMMDDIRENDESMFYVSVTMLVAAKSLKELNSITKSVKVIGKESAVDIEVHYLKQREALNTALPLGVRQVCTMRSLLTQPLAALLPFHIQEINHGRGIYYGINQISKSLIIANRKRLLNGNGFIFGVTGSGKSFFSKEEMLYIRLMLKDHVIVIDPMNEYFDIARTFGGTVINLSSQTHNYVNPLEVDIEHMSPAELEVVKREKSDFMLNLFDQILGDKLDQQHQSIIDRCTRILYQKAYEVRQVPIMSDYYHVLMQQNEDKARDLALNIEVFVEGSLNIFNHRTNVDTDSPFTVYGIQDLGEKLAPVAMLVMMEAIQRRIVNNGKRGVATWLYIDECHVLLKSKYSADYLYQMWKKVRKQGGMCTGISQNITDLLKNDEVATLISNSEFIALLKQSEIDAEKINKYTGITATQLQYVSNSARGTGLIKCGATTIPFDNRIDKDTDLYKLFNTDIHEKIAMGLIGEDAPQKPSNSWLI